MKHEWHWKLEDSTIYSADFEHDAGLRLTGDFGSDQQKTEYAEALVAKLNACAEADRESHLSRLVDLYAKALGHVLWIKDCGIDGRDPADGVFKNFPEAERDAMYRVAKEALEGKDCCGTSAQEVK